MATQVHSTRSQRTTFTPMFVLQMFAGGLIGAVPILSILVLVLKFVYGWEPEAVSIYAYSPVYAVAAAGACLVLSFLIPEFLLDSARRDLQKEKSREQCEDLPFIFVPAIFIRFSLLSIVAIIGFLMAITDHGVTVFLPFAIVSFLLMVAYFPTETRMKTWLYEH